MLQELFTFQVDFGSSVLLQNLIVIFAGKSTLTEHQQMENKPQAEHIADGVVFLLHVPDVNDFGGHIARGPASDEKIFTGLTELCEAEICDDAIQFILFSE